MKLGTYRADGALHCGVVTSDEAHVVDLDQLIPLPAGCASLDDVLAIPELWEQVKSIRSSELAAHPKRAISEVDLHSPVIRPSKVIVAGANSYTHLEEAGLYTLGVGPKRPMVLSKPPTAVAGPFDSIVYPPQTAQLDYEVELAVVIGARAKNVSLEAAISIVAGYTVANDLSARDIQLSSWEDNTFYRTHFLGKAIDGFCPMGPWLTTPDSMPDTVGLRSRVNGEIRQNGSLDDLVFGVAELVSYCSTYMTLVPGDVILTGTPAGVGYFMNPPGFLRPGDTISCEVDGIGSISNKIVGIEA